MSWFRLSLILLFVLAIVYICGPSPSTPVYNLSLPEVPELNHMETFIANNESKHQLRKDNEARIVWANDVLKQKTRYAIVYLHGFSASQEEGDPVHRDIAKKFGCNLYLARLAEHGIDTSEQLMNLTADKYWESAKMAFAIGKRLGDNVILMGTSTGASQALQLASAYTADISGLVLYSPNIAINDPNAWILNDHWGLQIARLVKGSLYNVPSDSREVYKQYWNSPYRLEAAVALQEMLETTMNKNTFKKITQPVLVLYYYRDKDHQDKVVKVSAMKEMFNELGTIKEQKRMIAVPAAGDHVIASPIKSKDIISVEMNTTSFMEEIIKISPPKN